MSFWLSATRFRVCLESQATECARPGRGVYVTGLRPKFQPAALRPWLRPGRAHSDSAATRN